MSALSPTVKRLLAVGLLVVVVLVVIVLGTGAASDDGSGGGTYEVRAIFDTASFLVPGEDVKIAGVKVGAIQSLTVTPQNKAAIVLNITDPAFKDFKRDAHCTIRLESLIGEKYVECTPTQPRDANAPPAPPLHQITQGDDKGQYYLPLANTSAPVDFDLLGNVMRLPERQRFAIILNELGVGLAGNGSQLRAVVRRADPALERFDRVLAILAGQNKTLANLARDSDAALAPLAQQRRSISEFIDKAGKTASATAARGDALEQNFAKFPAFLRQLRPTVRRLGQFAAAGTPVFADLRAVAPSINQIFEQIGPFSQAGIPAFKTLGQAAQVGSKALPAAQPVVEDIARLGAKTKPLANQLAKGLTKLQGQNGIQRVMDIVLGLTGTANGFSSASHYLRSYLAFIGNCLNYEGHQQFDCSSTFNQQGGAKQASASSAPPAATTAATSAVPTVSRLPKLPKASTGAQPHGAAPTDQPTGSGLLGYLIGGGSTR